MKNKIIKISSLILSILGAILTIMYIYLDEQILGLICLMCYIVSLIEYEKFKK